MITCVHAPYLKSDRLVHIDHASHTIHLIVQPQTDWRTMPLTFTTSDGADVQYVDGDLSSGARYQAADAIYTVTAEEWGNPFLPGLYGDPEIAVFGDRYYLYPTTDGRAGWASTYFKCFSSPDLVHWTDHGTILDLKDVAWSSGVYAWAPTIAERGGKYYFYFCGTQNIGVAVGDSPIGPFHDIGKPLVPKSLIPSLGGGQAIDPHCFIDDDGTPYLYFGNGNLWVATLNEDMCSFSSDIRRITPPHFREGIYVVKRGDTYYYTWSDDDAGSPNYHVNYGVSKTPWGDITYRGTILEKDASQSILGTGHHSIVKIPGRDEYYISYHRFTIPVADASDSAYNGNHREACLDRLIFSPSGEILPIRPTLTGVTEPQCPITNSVPTS